MEIINQYHEFAAAFIARVFLGVLFFFQGYDAVFNVKISNVIQTYKGTFANKGVPNYLIVAASWFNSLTEFICGGLLILGLFEYVALYLLALNLIIAAIGFGMDTPVWDTRHVIPRLALILFLLFIPESWHVFSLDKLINL